MKFMLLKTYGPTACCDTPINEWSQEEIRAHIDFQRALGAQLSEAGELVDAQGLAGPERAYEIAAQASAAPGPGGKPIGECIEVRAVMSAPATEE